MDDIKYLRRVLELAREAFEKGSVLKGADEKLIFKEK
jgi:hypothetical protein